MRSSQTPSNEVGCPLTRQRIVMCKRNMIIAVIRNGFSSPRDLCLVEINRLTFSRVFRMLIRISSKCVTLPSSSLSRDTDGRYDNR